MSGRRTPRTELTLGSTDARLVPIVREALSRISPLVVLHRLTRSAGRRDWYLLWREDQMDEILGKGAAHDAFTFFLQPQLRLRGRLDKSMADKLRRSLAEIPVNKSELILAREVPGETGLEDSEGFSRAEIEDLNQWMAEHMGETVAAGPHPPLLSRDPQDLVTAIVPDDQGRIEPGVY
jgi:hypothetical protein